MNFLDKRRTEKLVQLILYRIKSDKSIKFEFTHEMINNIYEEVVYAIIELSDKEYKLFNKLKHLEYFTRLISQYFNFSDQCGRIFSTRKIEGFEDNNANDKIKIKITLRQEIDMKNNNGCEKEAKTSGMKTTTQKYLIMNHKLIELRDAIFDPNVVGEKNEDEKTQKRVVNALDVLCHYIDDYKEFNGIKTRIKK